MFKECKSHTQKTIQKKQIQITSSPRRSCRSSMHCGRRNMGWRPSWCRYEAASLRILEHILRVFHGYGNTCSDWVTGMVWYLAHDNIPCTCTAVSQVCHGYVTGILPRGEHKFYGFETNFFLNLINFFHPVTPWHNQIWFCQPHVYILASYHQAALYSHSYHTTKTK